MPQKHRVRYALGTVIQVKRLADLEVKLNKVKMLTMTGKVPKNEPFFVTVDLPTMTPQNLLPVKKADESDIPSSLWVAAVVFDVPNAAAITDELPAATPMTIGEPVSHPQRKNKQKRILHHQTFEFAPPKGGFTQGKAFLYLYTMHRFYETAFKDHEPLAWVKEYQVV